MSNNLHYFVFLIIFVFFVFLSKLFIYKVIKKYNFYSLFCNVF